MIRQPGSSRAHENELAKVLEYMTLQIAKRFKSGALLAMDKSTLEKFEDCTAKVSREQQVISHIEEVQREKQVMVRFTDAVGQEWEREELQVFTDKKPVYTTERRPESVKLSQLKPTDHIISFTDVQLGNYAVRFLKLTGGVKRKILKQFNNDRITAMVADKLRKVDKRQQQQLYNAVEKAIGINTKELMRKENMGEEINALIAETSMWVENLRDEALESFTTNTMFAMTQGQSLDELLKQFDDVVETRKNHARFLAFNQVQNFNSITAKIRAQKLGIKKAIWDTSNDDTVRPSHRERDGKEFDLAEGLYSSIDKKHLIPGVDYNCRCTARYVLDDE